LHLAGKLVVEPHELLRGRGEITEISLVRDGVVFGAARTVGPCEPRTVFVLADNGGTRPLARGALTPPMGDAQGSYVAWFAANRDLVVMDVDTGATVARARAAVPDFGLFCDNPIRSVSETGVTFESAGTVYTFDWRLDPEPVRHDLPPGTLLDRAGRLDAIAEDSGLTDDAGLPLVQIRFVEDGTTLATSEPLASSEMYGYGLFSADGRYFAVTDDSLNPRIVVLDTRTATRQELDLADDYFAAGMGWGVGDTLMVGFRSKREDGIGPGPMPSRLAVCDISEGKCGFVTEDGRTRLGWPNLPHW
jgi:hypothetical protein